MSLWLPASASAGSSLRVGIRSWVQRMAMMPPESPRFGGHEERTVAGPRAEPETKKEEPRGSSLAGPPGPVSVLAEAGVGVEGLEPGGPLRHPQEEGRRHHHAGPCRGGRA